jgi:flagellar hook protein FlgE
MSILRSFNIGISGMNAAGGGMSVAGDNIANAGTTGFKSSRAEFQDMLAVSLKGVGGGDQIGSGSRLAHVKQLFNQGDITRTDNNTDLAISGDGFFVIDSITGRAYSRDGSFNFNKDGELVNGDGYKILGFSYLDGKPTNKLESIKLDATTIPAKATEKVGVLMNLDSRELPNKAFDIKDPETTSNFANSLVVFDNVGTERLVNMYFNKVDNNKWEYHVMVDGKDTDKGKPGELFEMASGKINFNDKGVLQEEVEGKNSFDFGGGAAPNQQIKFDFGKSIVEGGDGFRATTQYGAGSSVSRHTQNGNSAATLGSLTFNDKGILTAVYDNGDRRDVAQVSIARFENNQGLFKLGKNLFRESKDSGMAAVGRPTEAGRGEILVRSLELSTVDLAAEFVNLMTLSRNFKANTKVITTADDMIQEVLKLKT